MVNMISLGVVMCFVVLIGPVALVRGSAIPMWEFLSREEKMSFLYSMFANQVEGFCETSEVENCNRELLKYGLNRLKGMSDELLDALDPYQRGADNMIWDAMMSKHPLSKTTTRPKSSTSTAKPNSYEDESFGDVDFSIQTAASAKIDNVYRVPPPKGFVPRVDPSVEDVHVTYPQVMDVLTEKKGVFTRFQAGEEPVSSTSEKSLEYPELPLTGPMEVRVYPDGTPVRENRPLPQDEDLRQYKMSKVKIPSL
nr:unnamed protein product [Callosobruchus analis]